MTDLAIKIVEFFKDNQDKRYRAYQLARIFEVKSKEVTAAMQGLPIQSAVDGKDKVYFVVSDEVKSRTVTRGTPLRLLEKAKRDSRLMELNLSRCKEAYPNGGNFKSIS